MLPSELKSRFNSNSQSTRLPASRIAATVDKEADPSKELRPCESFHDVLRSINANPEEALLTQYGYCRRCGERVEWKRLAGDPAALICFSCELALEIDHTFRSC